MYDFIVAGAGYAGAVCARMIAEQLDKRVLVIDRRPHIAGNMYDFTDENGLLIHQYGPHVSVMDEEKAFGFLSRFTEWIPYHHTVRAEIDGTEVPLPFNLTGIDYLFDVKKALKLKKKLTEMYGFGANIPILQLKEAEDEEIRRLADYVYEKIFLHYTVKMWDLSPLEVDPSVIARIPIRLSYDDRHFLHKYQVMPKKGFTRLFENLLGHHNITVQLDTDAKEIIRLDERHRSILFYGNEFNGGLIYTGALDELFDFQFGELPYRSLEFEFKMWQKDHVQDSSVLNWPDERPATRRTEMKRLTGQKKDNVTVTVTEYPGTYQRGAEKYAEPYYPIANEECQRIYRKYREKAEQFPRLVPVGRLADYKYYNMEATVLRALDVFEHEICKEKA